VPGEVAAVGKRKRPITQTSRQAALDTKREKKRKRWKTTTAPRSAFAGKDVHTHANAATNSSFALPVLARLAGLAELIANQVISAVLYVGNPEANSDIHVTWRCEDGITVQGRSDVQGLAKGSNPSEVFRQASTSTLRQRWTDRW
jgi:hypothetical protein